MYVLYEYIIFERAYMLNLGRMEVLKEVHVVQ